MVPGDVFRLKGMVCTGTDARCYRENLSRAWGVYPVEIAAGTESTCIAAESRQRPGMVFFPDACFYEFIPREEMERSLEDRGYRPRTCLMDEVRAGQEYELVISVLHGGAFMRYRIGDMYRCLSAAAAPCPVHLPGPGAHGHRHRGLYPDHRVHGDGGDPPVQAGDWGLVCPEGI